MVQQRTIACPSCDDPAEFRFATWSQVGKADRPYFERSKDFHLFWGQHSHGSYFCGAYHLLGVDTPVENIDNLPNGYGPERWVPETSVHATLPNEIAGVGSVNCNTCHLRRRHRLSWPSDAYFQLIYRGHTLWAYNRKHALKMLGYIRSSERDKTIVGRYGDSYRTFVGEDWFLRRIPSIFLTAKARPRVVQKLEKLLKA